MTTFSRIIESVVKYHFSHFLFFINAPIHRPLKSFGFKKRSSTLGINKTSESPPPLRRYGGYNSETESNYSTFDKRVGFSTNNDFIRSSRYRSSLQNMNSVSPLGTRNEPNRSTMQYGTSRPIPVRSSYLTAQRGMTPG